MSAAMLPLRKEPMPKRSKRKSVGRPAAVRRNVRTTNTVPATSVTAKATGTGESANGHVHEPISKGFVLLHHP